MAGAMPIANQLSVFQGREDAIINREQWRQRAKELLETMTGPILA